MSGAVKEAREEAIRAKRKREWNLKTIKVGNNSWFQENTSDAISTDT